MYEIQASGCFGACLQERKQRLDQKSKVADKYHGVCLIKEEYTNTFARLARKGPGSLETFHIILL